MSDEPGIQWLVTELEFWKARAQSLERESVARDEATLSDVPSGLSTAVGTLYVSDLLTISPHMARSRIYLALGQAVAHAKAVTVLREPGGSALRLRVTIWRPLDGLDEADLERVAIGGSEAKR